MVIHGLGAALTKAIELALKLERDSFGALELSTTTSTVALVDDVDPLDEVCVCCETCMVPYEFGHDVFGFCAGRIADGAGAIQFSRAHHRAQEAKDNGDKHCQLSQRLQLSLMYSVIYFHGSEAIKFNNNNNKNNYIF